MALHEVYSNDHFMCIELKDKYQAYYFKQQIVMEKSINFRVVKLKEHCLIFQSQFITFDVCLVFDSTKKHKILPFLYLHDQFKKRDSLHVIYST
jgi:hypothetical protein